MIEPGSPAQADNALFSSNLGGALAEELKLASRLLNDLAFELASDPDVLRRHIESLQKIDLVTQIQYCVASILERGAPTEEPLAVGLESMAERLRLACS